jgi:hypothetical protein
MGDGGGLDASHLPEVYVVSNFWFRIKSGVGSFVRYSGSRHDFQSSRFLVRDLKELHSTRYEIR